MLFWLMTGFHAMADGWKSKDAPSPRSLIPRFRKW